MYVPAHFAADPATVADLLAHHGAADLVTPTPDGLIATLLPFVHDPAGPGPVDPGSVGSGSAAGGADHSGAGFGSLLGHVARNNPHWRQPATGESLVIVRGPDAYVSPSWYAAKAEHGRVVPTWNYVTAHVYGELVIHDEVEWVEAVVHRLTAKHETGRDQPWSVDDAPPSYIAGQLRAIVGVEVRISRIEAKLKLSQNRSAADVSGVITGLRTIGDEPTAAAMEQAATEQARP